MTAPATGPSALHAEDGPERGFTKGKGSPLADALKSLCETDGDGGLALPRAGGVNGGYQDDSAAAIPTGRRHLAADLSHLVAVDEKIIRIELKRFGNFQDRTH